MKTIYREFAKCAKEEAQKNYHGNIGGLKTNLKSIADLFNYSDEWTLNHWDNCWCAAFVFYCLDKCGLASRLNAIKGIGKYHFGSVVAWELWAKLPENNCWHEKTENIEVGDIVLFDYVFENAEHDHIGIVVNVDKEQIETAEGNVNNISAVMTRSYSNLRGFVRL